MKVEREFSCDQAGIRAAQAFLEGFGASSQAAIVMDEIVSNIVRCSGAKSFAISLERVADGLKMVFADSGIAFDPLRDVATPDVTAALGDRKIGGLGVFMVKKMSKSVAYSRTGGRNVLTVVM